MGYTSNAASSLGWNRFAWEFPTSLAAHAEKTSITNYLALNQKLRFSAQGEAERPHVM